MNEQKPFELQDVREGYGDSEIRHQEKGQQIFSAIEELKETGVEELNEAELIDYLLERVPELTKKDIEEYFPFERRYGDHS